ncbi:helicase-related protein [uncultured Algimonas sp.]|uniref:helicase-related protein n=1 Tax=uncultured Algimonas sp. TaxID=1547920 RepID=UPI00260E27AB|nr:helicase-related protein [uncultured Algimonas sp.]
MSSLGRPGQSSSQINVIFTEAGTEDDSARTDRRLAFRAPSPNIAPMAVQPILSPILRAILGPTNTGKTHYAVERMLGRSSGVIGLPLRLLAREVYDRIVARVGANSVALVTGEEKIVPPHARYYVCTVEAMPVEKRFAFLAVDEVQLMANHERGHVFTDRVLNARGYEETLFLGAETARDVLRTLVPDIRFDRRERFSELSYAGPTKLNRLPKRSVIVAFSAKEVYALAEAIRRLRGGAAVVMGGLSPRTRNAQAELFQSGDVDFLVATDAVGMGLNLDTHHVAFASLSKYDGRRRRYLTPMEAGQIAGRAGRFRQAGTFGTTGDCPEMDDALVDRIVGHEFEMLNYAEWRNSDLDFASLAALVESLHAPRPTKRLRRIKGTEDELSLERMMAIPEIAAGINLPVQVKQLWDVCQVPDFRNLTIDAHVRLLQDIYRTLVSGGGKLSNDFMARRVARCDDTSGDVDALSARLANIRTWTYCAAKASWMHDGEHWAQQARAVEDRLSDALHEGLIARFVDRRTSQLLKGIGSGAPMDASIKDDGSVFVDGHLIGQLEGLRFTRDADASDLEAKALEAAAVKAVTPEVDRRLTSLSSGQHAIFTLSDAGEILWGGMAVGRIAKSGSVFTPDVEVIGGELGNPTLRQLAEDRMREFLRAEVQTHLAPLKKLKDLQERDDMLPASKGFAYTLLEHHGSLDRRQHGKIVRDLGQQERRDLRSAGVVFGQYNVFMPELMKPKPARLLSLLVAYGAGGDRKPFVPFAGVTSIPNEGDLKSDGFAPQALSLAGYKAVGPRIVRFDILNRLATQIRDAQGQFEKVAQDKPGRPTFQIMSEMLAILGASHEETRGVLAALGFKSFTADAPLETAQAQAPEAERPEAQDETPAAWDQVAARDQGGATPEPPTAPDPAQVPDAASGEASVPDGGVPQPAAGLSPDAVVATQTAPGGAPDAPQTDVLQADAPQIDIPQADATKTDATKTDTIKTDPPATEAPKPSKRMRDRQRAPLSVYVPREQLEDGTSRDVPSLEYWTLPARQPRGHKGGRGGKPHHNRKPHGSKPPRGQGGKPGGKPKRSPDKAPRRSVENSPFAALAALKTGGTPDDKS